MLCYHLTVRFWSGRSVALCSPVSCCVELKLSASDGCRDQLRIRAAVTSQFLLRSPVSFLTLGHHRRQLLRKRPVERRGELRALV